MDVSAIAPFIASGTAVVSVIVSTYFQRLSFRKAERVISARSPFAFYHTQIAAHMMPLGLPMLYLSFSRSHESTQLPVSGLMQLPKACLSIHGLKMAIMTKRCH